MIRIENAQCMSKSVTVVIPNGILPYNLDDLHIIPMLIAVYLGFCLHLKEENQTKPYFK